MKPGPLNLITDVAGLSVGNMADPTLKSGVTVLVCDDAFTASVHVMGGAPGTRETDLLEPHNTVQGVDAIVLSGGSAFGLDAASGVQAALREMGRGFAVGPVGVPIVPAAILFDLTNGGNKDWGLYPLYRELGFEATKNATKIFDVGTAGAGTGANTAGLKGGLGSASTWMQNGTTVGALVAVNALGSVTIGETPHFWAAPFELGSEFGGLGMPYPFPENSHEIRTKLSQPAVPGSNTTIGIVATDAVLTKAECKRFAVAAHDGYARAIWPSHTPLDGDLIFTVATGRSGETLDLAGFNDLCALAASTMARAVARGVFAAAPEARDQMPVWSAKNR